MREFSIFDFRFSIWRKGAGAGLLLASVLVGMMVVRGNVPAGGERVAAQGGAGVGFVPVDVWVDSGKAKLGAYQVEVVAKDAVIVGLEGGEAKAFSSAPYYDPAALQGKRIVVAAFSTDADLPTGLTRVARLHMMVEGGGNGMPAMTEKLVVATDGEGRTVEARLSLKPIQGETR